MMNKENRVEICALGVIDSGPQIDFAQKKCGILFLELHNKPRDAVWEESIIIPLTP
jgi:hypothetical protein